MDIQLLHGSGIAPYIDEVARLRIAVFRDFPYLYDGTVEYEAEYLGTYLRSEDSLCVLVRDGDQVVGASTALPLEDESEAFQRPFVSAGWDVPRIFYYAESVLLPAYRGTGLGVRFFEEREAHARRLGRFSYCAFCAVQRPADHPRRPQDYVPLDAFWARRGYQHHPELHTEYRWRDLDEESESPKPMSFWIKPLEP